ncbi:MAG: DNA topoisomerase IV subunit B [Bacilli bacterium]|nr:DNA topoisomerase IV subunit B [Bacilli bacterium]
MYMPAKYDESSIKVLEGLEAVRKRPGMYIGSTDKRGLHHLVWEIVDNSIDEVMNGYGDTIKITINNDGSITVEDNGRGVPVGKHETGKSTVEVIYTMLHAGGKFEEGNYKVSGGLHGVGASVVNALSSYMIVNSRRDGKEYSITFKNGGEVDSKLKEVGKTNKTGTTVTFLPNKELFTATDFSYSTICERMQESAFLLKGLTVEVTDDRNGRHDKYHYDNGIKSFVEYINEDKTPINNILHFKGSKDGIEVEIAMQYTDSYNENIISFVNNVKTIDGGSHEVGFKSALTKAFNDYARKNNYLKAKDKNFEGADVREGLTAIVSLKIPEALLQFEGQTKGKLGTPIAKTVVEQITSENLGFYLEENKDGAVNIINKALKGKMARDAARKARDDARKSTGTKKEKNISDKLAPAARHDNTKNELFIVEGDSAGGSAKSGRDRTYQAILPLRGKVLNTEKASLDEAYKNAEINTLIYTIGAGVGGDFNVDSCNYDKVIIMTDADDDGCHIQVLLITFFYRYMKPLIEAGKLYIACPPLYKVKFSKNEEIYVYSDEELKEVTNGRKPEDLQRYKGLGEMDASQLWETTMDPATRTLIRVNLTDAVLAEKRVSVLMGEKVEPRKVWIEENVEFSLEDDYKINGE